MTDKKTILIIGPAPENIGGVSIHIRRLIDTLKSQYVFDFVDEGRQRWAGRYNIRSLNLVEYVRKLKSADIVHIHSGSVLLRIFNVVMSKCILRKKTIVTVHRDPNIEPMLWFTRYILRYPDTLICVNDKGINALTGKRKPGSTLHIPAFLPPQIEAEPELPEEVVTRIAHIKQCGGRLMVSNAGRLVMREGVDLYGLDMCVDALNQLVSTGQDWHLIFVIADTSGAEKYIAETEDRAQRLGIGHRLWIIKSPLSFVKLMQMADVVLRPTITDGDAISVREALYFNIPVVASDVAERPVGVIIHKSRDVQSLVKAIEQSAVKPNGDATDNVDFAKLYPKVYSI